MQWGWTPALFIFVSPGPVTTDQQIDLGITESFLSNISTGQGFHLLHLSVQVIYSQITYKCIQVVYIQIIYKLYSYMHTQRHTDTHFLFCIKLILVFLFIDSPPTLFFLFS